MLGTRFNSERHLRQFQLQNTIHTHAISAFMQVWLASLECYLYHQAVKFGTTVSLRGKQAHHVTHRPDAQGSETSGWYLADG